MGDNYRPGRSDRGRPPPLVDRMTFSSGGGDSYRPGDSRQQNGFRSANNSEFTFSSGRPGPQFPPTGPAADSHPHGRRKGNRDGMSSQHNQRDSTRNGYSGAGHPNGRYNNHGFRRGGFRKAAPHERPLLQSRDDDNTEHVLGVADGNKFLDLNDISDDDEADMDIESDKLPGDNDTASDGQEGNHKVARVQTSSRADGDSVPKWSNPDPYTVLPPPEETTGAKRDIVKLIRKAKNQSTETSASNNAVAANDDFISFGDDDDNASVQEDDSLPPLAPWARPSSGNPSIQGSLNEAAATGALSVAPHNAKRSAEAAGLPDKPQHSGKAQKRKRGELDAGIVKDWLAHPRSDPAPWLAPNAYIHLVQNPERW